MRAIERDYGIDYWVIWRLRYRLSQVKDIGVSVYARLEAAYVAECERQQRKLAEELAITRAIVGTHHPAVVASEAVVDAHKAAAERAADDGRLHADLGEPSGRKAAG